jgi:hypothetical protein
MMAFATHCPLCHATYENIGHPLKPGVIMQRLCKCTLRVQHQPGVTLTMLVPPSMLWHELLESLAAAPRSLDGDDPREG